MKIPFTIIISFAILGTSCHVNSTYTNRMEDAERADKELANFFRLKEESKFDSIPYLFSSKALEETSPKKMVEFLNENYNKLGTFMGRKLINWETFVVTGTDPKGKYELKYEAYYERDTITETFSLIGDERDSIELVGYNIIYN